MICIITMYIRDTNMAYIHTLKYFLNMLFLVAALTESLFKCIILDVSPQFSNFIFFIHSIFKKYFVKKEKKKSELQLQLYTMDNYR